MVVHKELAVVTVVVAVGPVRIQQREMAEVAEQSGE